MAVTLVQSASDHYVTNGGGVSNDGVTVSLSSGATTGSTLIAFVMVRSTETQPTFPAGWSVLASMTNDGTNASNMRGFWIAKKVVQAGDSSSVLIYNASYTGDGAVILAEFSGLGDGALDGEAEILNLDTSLEWATPTGMSSGVERVMFLMAGWDNFSGDPLPSASDGVTSVGSQTYGSGNRRLRAGFRYVASSSPPYTYTTTVSGWQRALHIGVTVVAVAAPVTPEPGIWMAVDPSRGFYGAGTASSVDALLARMLPQSSIGTAVSDNITSYIQSMTWSRGSSFDHTGSEQPGGATIRLKPSFTSSALYSLARPGLPVWCGADYTTGSVTSGTAVRGFFAGYTREIVTLVEDGLVTGVEILCDDPLASYRSRPVELTASAGRSQQDVRAAVLAAIDEDNRALATEPVELPISAVSSDDALGVLAELNRASGSRHFIAPADTKEDWYDYTTVNRNHKLGSAVDRSIDGDDVDAISGYRITWDNVVNYQKASVTPISFSPDSLIVWEYDSLPLSLDFRDSRVIWAEFDDYVLDASLEVSSTLSGGGTATGTLESFGKTAKITLYAGTRGTVTSLQIRGRQVQRADAQAVLAEDLASQNTYRLRSGSDISSDLIGQPADAQGVVDFLVWKFATPLKRPAIRIAAKSTTTLGHIFLLDLYDLVAVTLDRIGVSARRFEIVGLRGTMTPKSSAAPHWSIEFELQESPNQSALTLFTVGTSTVGGSHPIWI